MTPLSIRAATVDDASDIARVHVASWRETYAGLLPEHMLAALDVDARRQMWASVLSDPDMQAATRVLVLETGGKVVGFGACGNQRSPQLKISGFDGEIGAIYILNEARGLGAGRKLMSSLAEILAAVGRGGVSLWVLVENQAARRFYERLGGKLLGERFERLPEAVLTEVAYGWPDLKTLIG
ncbi:MAG: GNAT family N-acetyltransferase [Caulobacteraceae bacterium]